MHSCNHGEELRFKISVLFGTYKLLDKSLIVLQLSAHLSNLIENR